MDDHPIFDLICLGSGPAASTVAITCAKHEWSVAMVESREFGGTCALRGCNPKKVFTNAAALVSQFQLAKDRLARGDNVRIEWADLVRYQREFTNPVREQSEGKLQALGIKTFLGNPQFESEKTIRVGQYVIEARNIFIGTGASPVPLDIPGGDLVVTSDDFIELDSLPSDILFVGGGFISFEFAHAAVRAGAKVTIIDRNEVPLRSFDPDLVQLLHRCSEKAGMKILTKTVASSIEPQNGRFQVALQTLNGKALVSTELVVNSGGRAPNLTGMNLKTGRVAYGKHGVTVNPFLQSTTNPIVYAAGDCTDTGAPMLTPTANASARIAANNLLAERQSKSASLNSAGLQKQSADDGPIPQVVFSVPPLAAVGLSEAEALQQGLDIDIRLQDLSKKGEVRKLCASAAACKVLVDRQSDKILGAHLLGPQADEVINLFAVAIRCDLTATKLKRMLFTYPTMTAEYLRVL